MLRKFTTIVLPTAFAATFTYLGVTRILPEIHVKFFSKIQTGLLCKRPNVNQEKTK